MHTVFMQYRAFAHHHDELPAFHAAFIVLTLLAAAMFNLGVFGVLILFHMSLDMVKYREYHGYGWALTFKGMMKESLIDITLLMIGLVFAVYFHHSVGIASLSGLVRAEATLLHAVGTIVPKLKILHHFLRVASHIHHYLQYIHPKLHSAWTAADRWCGFLVAASFLLLLLAPVIMHLDISLIGNILLSELIPWRI